MQTFGSVPNARVCCERVLPSRSAQRRTWNSTPFGQLATLPSVSVSIRRMWTGFLFTCWLQLITLIGYRTDGAGFEFRKKSNFSYLHNVQEPPPPNSTQPFILSVKGLKRPGREAYHCVFIAGTGAILPLRWTLVRVFELLLRQIRLPGNWLTATCVAGGKSSSSGYVVTR
jgi:hypothetical protein